MMCWPYSTRWVGCPNPIFTKMKSLKIHYLFGLCVLLNTTACSQDGEPPKPDSIVYEACCGAEPVEYTQGDAYIYVPNVFTPNGDGINDLFYPFINEQVLEIANFQIKTAEGDTLIFTRQFLVYNDLDHNAWNGIWYDGSSFEGIPYIGAFKYTMLAILRTGEVVEIEGRACRIECGPDAEVFQSKEGCFYPNQINSTTGKLDGSLMTSETGCFH